MLLFIWPIFVTPAGYFFGKLSPHGGEKSNKFTINLSPEILSLQTESKKK